MRMTVADLMCETPVTINAKKSCDEALEVFFEYETPELYVVDASMRFLGVLPDYELIKAQLSGEAQSACIEQLMSRTVPTCSPESDAAEVARMFRDSSCSRVPVVKSGRLVGVVTRCDVLRVMAVLRRIDAPAAKSAKGPGRPKMLPASKPVGTRTARAKTVARKTNAVGGRSKIASRRLRTVSSR